MKKTFIYTFILAGCLITLAPFLWMLSTSLKSAGEVFNVPPTFIPTVWHWENYIEVKNQFPIGRYFFNSTVITLGITAGTLITTIMAAYAFSQVNFWGRDLIFSMFVATMIIPSEAILIPNYIMISKLGMINTYRGLIIPWTVSVFSIFLLRQFFLSIPATLYRAAKLDGCSDFHYVCRIMLPISKPALITVALLRVINSWNEFLWPLIVTNLPEMRTLPVALTTFVSEAGNRYHLLMAASTMIIIPIILVYICMQKYIITGIAKSGIKG